MPLIKRLIEPTELSRGKLTNSSASELEAVSVNTLCGIMRQLSSLSKHAEDVFGELFTEASNIHKRTESLQARIQGLSVKVTQLDSAGEQISLQDINLRKAFKSTIVTDQQVLSSTTLPTAMKERYFTCSEPPRLREMNPYRDDDKDALKFYTDPKYFFELWCEGMKKETERYKKRKKTPRTRTGTRAKAPVKAVKRKIYCPEGKEFEKNISIKATTHQHTETIQETTPEVKQNGVIPEVDEHIIPPPQPLTASPGQKGASRRYTQNQNVLRPTSAPPPPPMPGAGSHSPSHQGYPAGAPQPPPAALPEGVPAPPPPPPPPPMHGAGPRAPNGPARPPVGSQPTPSPSSMSLSTSNSTSSVASEVQMPPAVSAAVDSRSDLLAAIRQGMALKRTQVQEKKKVKEETGGMDTVASILARRIAVEYSSSEESETGSEWEDEDE